MKGRLTRPVDHARRPAQLPVATKQNISTRSNKELAQSTDNDPTSSGLRTATSVPGFPYRPTLVETVPHYVMRLSVHNCDQSDDGENEFDAVMFRDDIVKRLKAGLPDDAHRRLFGVFKLSESHSDPFEDAELSDTQPAAVSREKLRARIIAHVERLCVHQHRTAVYSFLILGREFRFMRWDRAGVFVTEKVDYVKNTRIFVELLLGFVVLDDPSQGIDTTATLLEKGSRLYKLMDSLAKGDPTVLKMRVLSFEEGYVLPEDLPVETFQTPSTPSNAHGPEASDWETSDHNSQQAVARSSIFPGVGEKAKTVRRPQEGSFVFRYVLDYFASSLEQDWPRYQLHIDNDTFLIARPIFETTGLIGRGTRGYVAWHEQSESFVFLKDAWRPFSHWEVEMEGDILKKLNDAGVEHIPTLLCHGQVVSQGSFVSHYAQCVDRQTNDERKAESHYRTCEETSKGRKRAREGERPPSHIRHYVHHRSAMKEVCLPLVAYTSSKQLVSLVTDCVDGELHRSPQSSSRLTILVGHADAVNKCGLLHRDISSGNILILPTFETTEEGTELRVAWRGILCDWELSKSIAQSENDEMARQPEQTVRNLPSLARRSTTHVGSRERGSTCPWPRCGMFCTLSTSQTRSSPSSTSSSTTLSDTCPIRSSTSLPPSLMNTSMGTRGFRTDT